MSMAYFAVRSMLYFGQGPTVCCDGNQKQINIRALPEKIPRLRSDNMQWLVPAQSRTALRLCQLNRRQIVLNHHGSNRSDLHSHSSHLYDTGLEVTGVRVQHTNLLN